MEALTKIAIAITLLTGCTTKGGLGVECSSTGDCAGGLTCAGAEGQAGICSSECTSDDQCNGGACVATELGKQCGLRCGSDADCEANHECSVSEDGAQVCWFGDVNLTPLPDFSFSHVVTIDDNPSPVTEVSAAEEGLISVEVSATFAGRGTATNLYARNLKTASPSVHFQHCWWIVPGYNSTDCSYDMDTNEFSCGGHADTGGGWTELESGETNGPYLRLQFDLVEGATVEPLVFTFLFGDEEGDTADGEIEIEVVP